MLFTVSLIAAAIVLMMMRRKELTENFVSLSSLKHAF